MKIFRPERYHKVFRITFSKKTENVTSKMAVTVVDTTKEKLDGHIRRVFCEELQRKGETVRDYVKLTVQLLTSLPGRKPAKDEWSYHLYRSSVNDIDRLIKSIDDMQ